MVAGPARRRHLLLLLVVGLGLTLAACTIPTATSTRELPAVAVSESFAYESTWRSVLCIAVEDTCAGSAWVIGPGLAVTAHHVVGPSDTVTFHTALSGPFTATVIGGDEARDVALLAFDPNSVLVPALPTRQIEFPGEMGVPLYALGFGGSDVKETGGVGAPSVRGGVFSQRADFGGDVGPNIKTDAIGTLGDSGGPLIDGRGRVVGMHRTRDADSGYSYAIPVETILQSIGQSREPLPTS